MQLRKIQPKSPFLQVCGAIGMAGCLAVLAADVIGIIVVEKHDPISETISRLAIGKDAWIQDLGLDLYALGLAAIAAGLFRWNRGGWRWHTAAGLFVLMAIDIVLIAEHNQYAPSGTPKDNIHMTCVITLYFLFAACSGLLAFELRALRKSFFWATATVFCVWIAGSPLFLYVVPDAYQGLTERIVGVAMATWVGLVAWILWQRGRAKIATA